MFVNVLEGLALDVECIVYECLGTVGARHCQSVEVVALVPQAECFRPMEPWSDRHEPVARAAFQFGLRQDPGRSWFSRIETQRLVLDGEDFGVSWRFV